MFFYSMRAALALFVGLAAGSASLPIRNGTADVHAQRMFWQRVCRRVLLLVAAWTLAVTSVSAAGTPKLTLPQLIELARQENKDLQVARYAVEIGQARLVQAGRYTNPRLEVAGSDDFLFKNDGEYNGAIGLSQEFPIAGRILRQQDVARVDVALAEAEIKEAERCLAGEIAVNFYRFVTINHQIAVRDQLIDVDQKLVKITQDRLRAAEVSEVDVNTVQLDLQRLQQERARFLSQEQTLVATLNQQLGRPASSPLELDATIPQIESLSSVQLEQAKALELRPDLRMAMLEADRAGAEKALAQARRWEDWTVGLGVQQDRVAIDGAPQQGSDRALMLSLSIPLPLLNKNQGAIAEADATGRQARARIEALTLAIGTEVASPHAEASRLEKLLREFQDSLLPISERNVQLAQRGYGQGIVSILEVTQALRQQGDLNVAYNDTLDQYLGALARLHTAVGDYSAPVPAASGQASESIPRKN